MITTSWGLVPDNSSLMPKVIKEIYTLVLKQGNFVVFQKLHWTFPEAYLLDVYRSSIKQVFDLQKDVVLVPCRVDETYKIASYILQAGEIRKFLIGRPP